MRRERASRLVALTLLVGVLAGCGGDENGGGEGEETQAVATESGCRVVDAPEAGDRPQEKPTRPLDPDRTYDLVLRTNCGSFTIRLDTKAAPATTASLVSLARKGYFDDTTFHRIVPGFVIQGGDPTGSGSGGPGYQTIDEPPPSARYTHGVVAMAKTAEEPAGTSGSQFFVVTGENVGLPPDYAVVGEVTTGLDVVDRIGELGDPATEEPTQNIVIERATVEVS